ncbi:unnamed protein product [Protopolystoma xenopodis]|uniref:UBA domain-containing protein n=1 Tax=Protopolystoma xenopodis TaxID=117903 RepID=A0A448WID2_9PLAT|nr:unnamed protein product [Protopolystoma xenopodis]
MARLIDMGFPVDASASALRGADGDLSRAVSLLLEVPFKSKPGAEESTQPNPLSCAPSTGFSSCFSLNNENNVMNYTNTSGSIEESDYDYSSDFDNVSVISDGINQASKYNSDQFEEHGLRLTTNSSITSTLESVSASSCQSTLMSAGLPSNSHKEAGGYLITLLQTVVDALTPRLSVVQIATSISVCLIDDCLDADVPLAEITATGDL